MTKIAFICGPKGYELSRYGDIQMVLAQHVIPENEEYIYNLMQSDMYKIIDNGAHENCQVTTDELLDRAKMINADTIIVPDIVYEGIKTVTACNDFFHTLSDSDKKRFNWMVVPQGKTKREWMHCMKELHDMQHSTHIGLSRLSIPKCFGGKTLFESRAMCLSYTNKLISKPIHLLGLTDPNEVAYYTRIGYTGIESVDTSIPFFDGLKSYRFEYNGMRNIPKYSKDEQKTFGYYKDYHEGNVMHNMFVFKMIIGGD